MLRRPSNKGLLMAVPALHAMMTAEELFALSGGDSKYELVEGESIGNSI